MKYDFSDNVSNLQGSVIREILKFSSEPGVISFAAGNPAPEAFPVEEIEQISKEIFAEDPILALQYSITEGYPKLRQQIKDWMEKEGNFNPETDELIITSGAQQANELTAKVLCNKGDTLVCEAPSFIGSLNAFKSYGVDLQGIELEEDGINIDKLEETLKTKKVKVIYLIPNFQNPTGLTTSLEKRKKVYELAKQYGAVILEDNPYGYLRFAGNDIPSIKSLDKDGVVVYSGTFSKILAPGIRVGYVSGPKEIIQKIVVCKQVSDVHTNIWAQVLASKFLEKTNMQTHLATLRAIYKHKCKLMTDEIEKNFSKKITFTKPEGGLFLWCTLPEDCDMMSFCSRAVQEFKVATVPGTAFMVNESDKTTSFRLNFSTPTDEQIVEGCRRIGQLSKEMFD
ncbi:MAG: PLP-dependent aminotransferase family protein [Oscillospiraceae bacterium]